jgi:hypothetical protein
MEKLQIEFQANFKISGGLAPNNWTEPEKIEIRKYLEEILSPLKSPIEADGITLIAIKNESRPHRVTIKDAGTQKLAALVADLIY